MQENKQVQKELFDEFAETEKRKHPKGIFQPKLKEAINLSSENLIFVAIAFIIACVISFSLGVERGKRIEARRADTAKSQIQQIEEAAKETKPEAVAEKEKSQVQSIEAAKTKEQEALKKKQTKTEEVQALYTVQAASYIKKAGAEAEAEQLKKKGLKAFVVTTDKYHILCVGEFKDKAQANSEQKRLRSLYPDCFVKKYRAS